LPPPHLLLQEGSAISPKEYNKFHKINIQNNLPNQKTCFITNRKANNLTTTEQKQKAKRYLFVLRRNNTTYGNSKMEVKLEETS